MAPHNFNVWVDPNAEDKYLLSKLNLSCVNALRGCRSLSQIAPEAWQRYEGDLRVLESTLPYETEQASTACAASLNTQ
jgi:hypothetical protein